MKNYSDSDLRRELERREWERDEIERRIYIGEIEATDAITARITSMNYDLWRIPPQDIEPEQIEGTRWDSDQGRWITEDFEDDGPQQQPEKDNKHEN